MIIAASQRDEIETFITRGSTARNPTNPPEIAPIQVMPTLRCRVRVNAHTQGSVIHATNAAHAKPIRPAKAEATTTPQSATIADTNVGPTESNENSATTVVYDPTRRAATPKSIG
jgi:hypothetical protein